MRISAQTSDRDKRVIAGRMSAAAFSGEAPSPPPDSCIPSVFYNRTMCSFASHSWGECRPLSHRSDAPSYALLEVILLSTDDHGDTTTIFLHSLNLSIFRFARRDRDKNRCSIRRSQTRTETRRKNRDSNRDSTRPTRRHTARNEKS